MARIGKVIDFFRVILRGIPATDVKFDPGGGSNLTGTHFSDPGDDAFPLPGDYLTSVETPKSGNQSVVGYHDPVNTQKATAGDKRIYSRRTSDGKYIAEGWLKSDGTIIHNSYKFDGDTRLLICSHTMNSVAGTVICQVFSDGGTVMARHVIDAAGTHLLDNDAGGSIQMLANGDVNINGTVFQSGNPVIVPTSLSVAGKELAGHDHGGIEPGAGTTGPNN